MHPLALRAASAHDRAMAHTHPHPGPAQRPEQRNAAQAAFEATGEQWTPMRASVYDVLLDHPGPVGAYDVAEQVSKALGRRIAPNTVYRILDLFVARNLVSRIESRNAFMASAHPAQADDCIFLVCDSCGKTTHLDHSGVTDQVRAVASAAGFHPTRPMIEVLGQCAACRINPA
jgi:Fur family transcriptional regulator, zinc uptake regulator